MGHPLCQQCGITQTRIDEMLSLLELGERDHNIAGVLQSRVIIPNLEQIIESFYIYLQTHREYAEYFLPGEQLIRMAQTQQNYLRSLGVNFLSPDYFEGRLKIGIIHNRIGLPPRLYECAYSKLRELISDFIPDDAEHELRCALSRFLNRIITLDISLALESYYQVNIGNLQASIDALEKSNDMLLARSQTDTLTGVSNRAAILNSAKDCIENFTTKGKTFTIVMCDVDNLRLVNDRLGHMAGDLVLKHVVKLILSRIRSGDMIGRYGGDEFLILLQETGADRANKIMMEIVSLLADSNMVIRDNKVKHTISFGITTVKSGDDLPGLLMRVDQSLATAKHRLKQATG